MSTKMDGVRSVLEIDGRRSKSACQGVRTGRKLGFMASRRELGKKESPDGHSTCRWNGQEAKTFREGRGDVKWTRMGVNMPTGRSQCTVVYLRLHPTSLGFTPAPVDFSGLI